MKSLRIRCQLYLYSITFYTFHPFSCIKKAPDFSDAFWQAPRFERGSRPSTRAPRPAPSLAFFIIPQICYSFYHCFSSLLNFENRFSIRYTRPSWQITVDPIWCSLSNNFRMSSRDGKELLGWLCITSYIRRLLVSSRSCSTLLKPH